MAEEQFTIVWIDDTGTNRNNLLRVDDALCLLRLAEQTRVGSSKYTLDRIYRFLDWSTLANTPGQITGKYFGKYRDNDAVEIEEIRDNFSIILNNNFRTDWPNWSEKQVMAYAADKLCQYLFKCKPIFDRDVNNKPNEPLVFTHPVFFDYEIKPNSGVDDGEIKIIPRGGTRPFDYKLDANNYVSIAGNFVDITGLATGTYNIRIRDANSQVSIPVDINVPDASI